MSLDFDLVCNSCGDINYSGNMTGNVVPMWKKAGVYDALYNSNGQEAKSIIQYLRDGINVMERQPKTYKRLDDKEGWGTYEQALEFLCEVFEACKKYESAIIEIWK